MTNKTLTMLPPGWYEQIDDAVKYIDCNGDVVGIVDPNKLKKVIFYRKYEPEKELNTGTGE